METSQFTYCNENSELIGRPAKRRRSSILKAPRSPLKEVNSGNWADQDITERRRKSSRRVSFADTKQIKVFSRDVHTENEETAGSTEKDVNTGSQILLNREKSTDNAKCQISGMETLLCAPIQTPVQQTEWASHADVFVPDEKQNLDSAFSIDCAIERPSDTANNHKVNQTEFEQSGSLIGSLGFKPLTSLSSTCSDNANSLQESSETSASSQKVCSEQSFRNFLASLNILGQGIKSADKKKTVAHSVSQPTHTSASFSYPCKIGNSAVKKIDFKHFLANMNCGRQSAVGAEVIEKENIFPLEKTEYSKNQCTESSFTDDRVFGSPKDSTGDLSKIFKMQDGGMEVKECHMTSVSAFLTSASDAPHGQFGRSDVTMLCGDVMDMTLNQTEKIQDSNSTSISKPKKTEAAAIGRDGTRLLNNPCHLEEITSSNQTLHLVPSKDKTLGEEDVDITTTGITKIFKDDAEMEITQCHTVNIDALSVNDGKENKFRYGDNTMLCGDNMDMTFNCTDVSFSKINASKTTPLDYPLTVSGTISTVFSGVGKLVSSHPVNLADDSGQNPISGTFPEKNNLGEETATMFTDNLTEGFKGHDGDMEMTQCHTAKVNTFLSIVDVQQNPLPHGEVTMLLEDGMDITLNCTEDVSLAKIRSARISVTEMGQDATSWEETGRIPTNTFQFKLKALGNNFYSTKLSESSNAHKVMDITKNHSIVIDSKITGELRNEGKEILICKEMPLPVFSEQEGRTVSLRNEEEDMDYNQCHSCAAKAKPEAYKLNASELQNVLEPITSPQGDGISVSLKGHFKEQDTLTGNDQASNLNALHAPCSSAGVLCGSFMEHIYKSGIPIASSSAESTSIVNMCHASCVKEKTVFLDCDLMDLTRSHTVSVDTRKFEVGSAEGLNDAGKMEPIATYCIRSDLPCDKTIIFTAGEQDDMEITKSHTVPSDSEMCLGSNNTVLTKRKSAAVATRVSEGTGCSHLAEKTVGFLEEDMEMTKCHAIALQIVNTECILAEGMNTVKLGGSFAASTRSFPITDKTVIFPLDNPDDMEITKSHTVTIDDQTCSQVKNVNDARKSIISSVSGDCASFPEAKENSGTMATVTVNTDLNATFDSRQTVSQCDGAKDINFKPKFSKSLLLIDDIVSSVQLQGDMEVAGRPAAAIDRKNSDTIFGQKQMQSDITGSNLPLKEIDKSVCFDDQEVMGMTRNHTILSCGNFMDQSIREKSSIFLSIGEADDTAANCSFHSEVKNTVSSEGDEMGISKTCSAAIDQINLGLVSDEYLIDSVETGICAAVCVSRKPVPSCERTVLFPEKYDKEMNKSHIVTTDSQTLNQEFIHFSDSRKSISDSVNTGPFDQTALLPDEEKNALVMGCNAGINAVPVSRQCFSNTLTFKQVKAIVPECSRFLPSVSIALLEGQDEKEITKSPTAAVYFKNTDKSDTFLLKRNDETVVCDSCKTEGDTGIHTGALTGNITDEFHKEKSSMPFVEESINVASSGHRASPENIAVLSCSGMATPLTHIVATDNLNLGIISGHEANNVGKKESACLPSRESIFPEDKQDMEIDQSGMVATDNEACIKDHECFSESRKSILESMSHDSNKTVVLFLESGKNSDITDSSDINTYINVVPVAEQIASQCCVMKENNAVVSANKNASLAEDLHDQEMIRTHTAIINTVDANAITRPKQIMLDNKEHDFLLKDIENVVYVDHPEDMVISRSPVSIVSGNAMELNQKGDISMFPYTKETNKINDMSHVSHLEVRSVVFSGDDMGITKSHTAAIEHININVSVEGAKDTVKIGKCSPPRRSSVLNDKAIFFSSDLQEVEFTKCCSVPLENLSISQKFNDLNESGKGISISVNSNFLERLKLTDDQENSNGTFTMGFSANPCMGQRVIRDGGFTVENGTISENGEIVLFTDNISSTKGQDEMEMTRSHTVAIDFRETDGCISPKQLKMVIKDSLLSNENEKSLASSDMDLRISPVVVSSSFIHPDIKENISVHSCKGKSNKVTINNCTCAEEAGIIISDMTIPQSQTAAIDKENMLMLPSEEESDSLGNMSTLSCTEEKRDVLSDGLGITKSQIAATGHVDSRLVLGSSAKDVEMETHVSVPRMSVILSDKTIIFPPDQNAMEVTKCTLPLDSLNTGQEFRCVNESVKSLPLSLNVDFVGRTNRITSKSNKLLLSADNHLSIEDQDETEVTKSHTVAIATKNIEVTSNKQTGLDIKGNDYVLNANCKVFVCYNDQEAAQGRINHGYVAVDNDTNQSYKERFSMTPCDIADVDPSFSEDKIVSTGHDTEKMKNSVVVMEDTNFGDTTAEGCKCAGETEICAPVSCESFLISKKSIIYSAGEQCNMEITEGLTVVIDDKTVNQEFDASDVPLKKHASVCPINRTILFHDGENMDTTAYGNAATDADFVSSPSESLHQPCAISPLEYYSEPLFKKALVYTMKDPDDMEMTLNHTGATVLPSGKLNDAVNSGSLASPGDETELLGDDMDATKSHTVVIDSTNHSFFSGGGAKDVSEGKKFNHLLGKSNFLCDKTTVFPVAQGSMAIESHAADSDQASRSPAFNHLNRSKQCILASVSMDPIERIASPPIEENGDPAPTSNKVGLAALQRASQSLSSNHRIRPEHLVTTLSEKQLFSSKEQCKLENSKILSNNIDPKDGNGLLRQKEMYSISESSSTAKENENAQKYINNLEASNTPRVLMDVNGGELLEQTDRKASIRISGDAANKCHLSFSEEKTITSSGEDMDTTKSHTAVLEDIKYGIILSRESKALMKYSTFGASVKSNEDNVVSQTDYKDMEISRSPTVVLESPTLGQRIKCFNKLRKGTLALVYEGLVDRKTLFPEGKDVDLSGCTDTADVVPGASQSTLLYHGVKTLNNNPDDKVLFPADKTIIFESEQENMELTASHTAVVDFKNAEREVSQNQTWADSKENKLLLTGNDGSLSFNNHTVDFAKSSAIVNCDSLTDLLHVDRICAIPSREAAHNADEVDSVSCRGNITFPRDDVRNITKSHCVILDDIKQDSVTNGVAKLGEYNSNYRKSIGPCDKTILFSADTQGDMEITASHTTAIDTHIVCQSTEHVSKSKNISGSVSVGTDDKTIFAEEEGNMDMTNCTAAGINVKRVESTTQNVSQSSITEKLTSSISASSKSLLATGSSVVFASEQQNNLEMTSSHTAAIEISLPCTSVIQLQMWPDVKESDVPLQKNTSLDCFDSHNSMHMMKSHSCSSGYNLRDKTCQQQISSMSGGSKSITNLGILSNHEEKPGVDSEKNNSTVSENHPLAPVRNCGLIASDIPKDRREVKSGLHCKKSCLSCDATVISSEKDDMEFAETCIHVGSPICSQKCGHLNKPSRSVSSSSCRFPVDKTVVFQEDEAGDLNSNAVSFGSMNAPVRKMPVFITGSAEKTFCAFPLEKNNCVSATNEKKVQFPVENNYTEETTNHTVAESCEAPERTVSLNPISLSMKTGIFCSNDLNAAAPSTGKIFDRSLSGDKNITHSNPAILEAANGLHTRRKSTHVSDLLCNQDCVALSDIELSTTKKYSGKFVHQRVFGNDRLEQDLDIFGKKSIANNEAMDLTVNHMSALKPTHVSQESSASAMENSAMSLKQSEMEVPENYAVTTNDANASEMDCVNHTITDMSVGLTFPASCNRNDPLFEGPEEMEVSKTCSVPATKFSFTNTRLQPDLHPDGMCYGKITAAEDQVLPMAQTNNGAAGNCTLEKLNTKSIVRVSLRLPGNPFKNVDLQSDLSTESKRNDELDNLQKAAGSVSQDLCSESVHTSDVLSKTKGKCISEQAAVSDQSVRYSELESEILGLPKKHTSLVECSGLQNSTREHTSPSLPSHKKLSRIRDLPEYRDLTNFSSEDPQKNYTNIKVAFIDSRARTTAAVSEFTVPKQCSHTGQSSECVRYTDTIICDSCSRDRNELELPCNTLGSDEQHSSTGSAEELEKDCISSCRNAISTECTSTTTEQGKITLECQAENCDNFHSQLKATPSSKPQIKRLPLGVFLPMLPKKKKCVDVPVLETSLIKAADPRLSVSLPSCRPSSVESIFISKAVEKSELMQYITEEIPPDCGEEMDSTPSVAYEISEGSCEKQTVEVLLEDMKKENEDKTDAATKQNLKRQRLEEYEEYLNVEKKCRIVDNYKDGSTTQMQASCLADVLWENTSKTATGDAVMTGVLKKGVDFSTSSGNSSDSTKGEGTFTDFSIQRCSQMESQMLQDASYESHLRAKVWDGTITVKEFFKLLHVNLLIQKPRQSSLPAKCTSKQPTAEAQLLDKHIYHPALHVYQEDSKTLTQTSEQLKLRLKDLDKYLVDVNKSLWENIKMSSDDQVKCLQSDLVKMKCYFTKKSKLIVHEGKVDLYDKLSEMVQGQREQLELKIVTTDELINEVDRQIAALETDIANLDSFQMKEDDIMMQKELEMRAREQEYENLVTESEQYQSQLQDMSNQNQKILFQIKDMEKTMSSCVQDLEDFSFSVWKIIEWEDDHALFTFLSGSFELKVFFGKPVGNAEFCDQPCRQILDVKFQSLLNDETAPMAGHLVHRLIVHFIEGSIVWHQKYSSHTQLPCLLHDISLVVSRYEMLGEEIHILSKWGGKYSILNVEVLQMELKILFSSTLMTAKFEITIPLGPWYPMNPLKFTFRKLFGKVGHEHVSSILSSVPPGCHYIKRLVEKIHQDLLCGAQFGQKG